MRSARAGGERADSQESAGDRARPSVDELARRYADLVCETFPVAATALGRHEHDDRLGTFDADTFDVYVRGLHNLRQSLTNAVASDGPERIDARALDGTIATELLDIEDEHRWRRDPGRAVETALSGAFALLLREYAPLPERLAALAGRLGEMPAFLDGAARSWDDVPAIWAESASESAAVGASFLREDLPGALGDAPADVTARVLDAASGAADALDRTAAAIDALAPGGPWAAGESAFATRLRTEHHLDIPPDALAVWGERQVEETLALLEHLSPDWRAAAERLKDDHPSPEALVETYRAEMERTHEFTRRTKLAPTAPAGLDVRPTPRFWAHLMPYAAYDPPGWFETDQRGIFWVTVPTGPDAAQALRDHCRTSIVVTAAHEGYPGHHLQLTRANEVAGLARSLAASALTVEGWAFYCEHLLWEQGYFENDTGLRIAQLKDQLWRALRVVLDVGLHCDGLSVDDAAGELVKVAALEAGNAEAEVNRYTSTPAYQVCYARGKAEILALREREQVRRAADFDLGRFHDELLGYGSVAVPLVAEEMARRASDGVPPDER